LIYDVKLLSQTKNANTKLVVSNKVSVNEAVFTVKYGCNSRLIVVYARQIVNRKYQDVDTVKYGPYRRYAQPVCMECVADIAMKEVRDRMAHAAARAPCNAHKL